MTGIQRWRDNWYGDDHGEMTPGDDGEYVKHADHVEALRQAQADERKNIVQMLRYNTIISIWLTAGDEQQRQEAEFVLHRISNDPQHCDPRRSCASRTDGHWEACHAATPE